MRGGSLTIVFEAVSGTKQSEHRERFRDNRRLRNGRRLPIALSSVGPKCIGRRDIVEAFGCNLDLETINQGCDGSCDTQ